MHYDLQNVRKLFWRTLNTFIYLFKCERFAISIFSDEKQMVTDLYEQVREKGSEEVHV